MGMISEISGDFTAFEDAIFVLLCHPCQRLIIPKLSVWQLILLKKIFP